jgi:hypothetical protein
MGNGNGCFVWGQYGQSNMLMYQHVTACGSMTCGALPLMTVVWTGVDFWFGGGGHVQATDAMLEEALSVCHRGTLVRMLPWQVYGTSSASEVAALLYRMACNSEYRCAMRFTTPLTHLSRFWARNPGGGPHGLADTWLSFADQSETLGYPSDGVTMDGWKPAGRRFALPA